MDTAGARNGKDEKRAKWRSYAYNGVIGAS